jgi:hypothetical protein
MGHILIIDDEEQLRKLLGRILEPLLDSSYLLLNLLPNRYPDITIIEPLDL